MAYDTRKPILSSGIFYTYRVATCRNQMLKGIFPISWLYDKSLIITTAPIGKSENIQDLKACTVPDIIRNGSRQVVASHITAWQIKIFDRSKYLSYCQVKPLMCWNSSIDMQQYKDHLLQKYLLLKDTSVVTYKYHNPVSWHMSGESVPTKKLLRNPLKVIRIW